ncbi:hypothetical protein [Methylobacterium sp. NEAU K]|uniref:hypothetical protein n=1 Tax=Methylobacterium sp. NEAU K TaxID=3064946 RepID=UPI0027336E03|nr:hypothetical protein [Methylobacterium sp. NEAU K]MDP4006891.1 hypothetical protein [Methylobacterium sp. NEAU K]
MSALKKIERDQHAAEFAAVTALLDQLTASDIITRMGLEARRDEIAAALAGMTDEPKVPTASAALFFGGKPVAGSRGIESEFGGNAVTKFQDLVAKLMADEAGALGQRGIVPNKGAATLHITNVVRGSFGFLLEEVEPQGEAIDTSLKVAVDNAAQLLSAFGETSEDKFRAAVEKIDQRVLTTAQEFFSLMRTSGATFRLLAGDEDRSFGPEAVSRAAERASSTRVTETEEQIEGQLGGVLPDAHQFEFRSVSRGPVKGSIDRAIPSSELAELNRTLVNVDAVATLKVRRVLRDGEIARESFTLLRLDARQEPSAAL